MILSGGNPDSYWKKEDSRGRGGVLLVGGVQPWGELCKIYSEQIDIVLLGKELHKQLSKSPN